MTNQANESNESNETQLSQILAFTEKQQEKTLQLISDTQKTMDEFKPFEQASEVNTQVETLMKSVNDELEKSMEAVNQQMTAINQSAS